MTCFAYHSEVTQYLKNLVTQGRTRSVHFVQDDNSGEILNKFEG
jgi:hypothetical protein